MQRRTAVGETLPNEDFRRRLAEEREVLRREGREVRPWLSFSPRHNACLPVAPHFQFLPTPQLLAMDGTLVHSVTSMATRAAADPRRRQLPASHTPSTAHGVVMGAVAGDSVALRSYGVGRACLSSSNPCIHDALTCQERKKTCIATTALRLTFAEMLLSFVSWLLSSSLLSLLKSSVEVRPLLLVLAQNVVFLRAVAPVVDSVSTNSTVMVLLLRSARTFVSTAHAGERVQRCWIHLRARSEAPPLLLALRKPF